MAHAPRGRAFSSGFAYILRSPDTFNRLPSRAPLATSPPVSTDPALRYVARVMAIRNRINSLSIFFLRDTPRFPFCSFFHRRSPIVAFVTGFIDLQKHTPFGSASSSFFFRFLSSSRAARSRSKRRPTPLFGHRLIANVPPLFFTFSLSPSSPFFARVESSFDLSVARFRSGSSNQPPPFLFPPFGP